jgi:glycine hydroxymethyltransferase
MGRIFRFVRYKTRPDERGRIDFDHLRDLALETRPKIVLCGYTSYPRDYDYADFKRVADEVGAITMADVAQIGGLIAAGVMENPFDHGFDIVTTTTHKTLRGPRAGVVLCRKPFAKRIDRSVFPGLQGGPHMHTIAAVAVALGKALEPEFAEYGARVLRNAKALARGLSNQGAELVTGGTDNHMMVVDTVKSFGIDGRKVEAILDRVSITVNKQIIPDDPNPPLRPSGIRLGSPAATTRGMNEADMEQLAAWICAAISSRADESALHQLEAEVERFCSRYPVPGISQPGRSAANGA